MEQVYTNHSLIQNSVLKAVLSSKLKTNKQENKQLLVQN